MRRSYIFIRSFVSYPALYIFRQKCGNICISVRIRYRVHARSQCYNHMHDPSIFRKIRENIPGIRSTELLHIYRERAFNIFQRSRIREFRVEFGHTYVGIGGGRRYRGGISVRQKMEQLQALVNFNRTLNKKSRQQPG